MSFVSGLPAATVDPEHNRFACAGFSGIVDIENVSDMPVFDVRDVALNSLSGLSRRFLSEHTEQNDYCAGEERAVAAHRSPERLNGC